MKYPIKGWVKDSFCDWDTRISSVIFLPGCNMRCGFCHNWQLVERYQGMEDIEWAQVKGYLTANRDFIDGLVITGGEPFISDFLFELIEEIKKLGFAVKVDTNGTFPDKL
ncbi:MAG: radical SAM protein, partial [bacterium]|nr:radical SAM protein [bacterium]